MDRIIFGITWRDRKRASWIWVQIKVEDILTTIKSEWLLVGHNICQKDNIWTTRITE